MRWGVLWTLLPDEVLPLLVMSVGLALILGLLSGRTALSILALLLSVRFNRAVGGESGVGELTSPKRIPSQAVEKVVPLR